MPFKKLISVIASTAILLTSASISDLTANAEITTLLNTTFESGTENWAAWGSSSVAVSTGNAHSGNACLSITNRQQNWNGASRTMLGIFQAGNTYDINAWVMFDNGNDTEDISLQLKYKDSEGSDHYVEIASATAQKNEWTEISNQSYQVPSDAVDYTIYFQTPENLINFYADDISILGEDTSSSTVKGDGYFNDDFESGKMGWAPRSGESVELVSTQAHSGSNSIFVSNRTEIWNGASANKASVLNAGDAYNFSTWVMFNGDSYSGTQGFSINLQYNQNGTDKYVEIGNASATKGVWTEITGTASIPADALGVNVYIQTAYTSNPSQQDLMDFYIDDVSASEFTQNIQTNIASLKEVYKNYFKIGCASTDNELSYKATQDLIAKHYNSITFGNELKPDSVLDKSATIAYMNSTGDQTNPQITLASAKNLLEYAQENNIPVRGHVLVWHSQTPDWFFKENFSDDGNWVSKEVMIQRMENYIKNLMGSLATQYPDVNFYAWDVVNEAFKDSGTMRDPGSNNLVPEQSAWVQVFGDDSFIDYAFKFARKYAPADCKLFYNDYNEYIQAKRDAIYNKALELKENNLIDGIGMQAHLDMSFPSVSQFKDAVEKFASTGLEVQITELDITQTDTSESGLSAQAQQFKDIMNAICDVRRDGGKITAVVFWGITDATSWRSSRVPLLFDADYQAKPAFYSITENVAEFDGGYQTGDLNKDGSVNISDLILMHKFILGQKVDIDGELADINKDSKINAFDSTSLKKIIFNM